MPKHNTAAVGHGAHYARALFRGDTMQGRHVFAIGMFLQHASKVIQSQKPEQCAMLLPPTNCRTGHLLPICNTGQPSYNSHTANAARFSQQRCTRGVLRQLPCAPEQPQHNCPFMLHMTQSRTSRGRPTLNNNSTRPRTVPVPD